MGQGGGKPRPYPATITRAGASPARTLLRLPGRGQAPALVIVRYVRASGACPHPGLCPQVAEKLLNGRVACRFLAYSLRH
jgi:hypothetical protein